MTYPFPEANRLRRAILSAVLLCALLGVLTVPAARADSPQPVVLVDQWHFNALSLNPSATWRMTMLRDELVAGGYAVQPLNGPITPEALAGCSLFLSTTPNVDYSSGEIAALQGFVGQGGGLLFCTSYGADSQGLPTPWADICQTIATAFGYTLDNNSAKDALHSVSGNTSWITFGATPLGTHPIDQGVSSMQCYATTTLIGPSGSAMIVRTDGDAVPSLRPAIMAGVYGTGRALVSGSSLYLADPIPNRDIGGLAAADNRRFAYNAVTWLAGGGGRPLVSLTAPVEGAILYGSADISGTVCDATLTNYVVQYAPASNPAAWTQIGPAHSSSVLQGVLGTWNTSGVPEGSYLLRVAASNLAGSTFSRTVSVQVKLLHEIARVSDIRSLADGDLVKLVGKEVIAGSDDLNGRVYIEESDRSSGVGVLTSQSANRRDLATVTGVLDLTQGEPLIHGLSVSASAWAGPYVRPLALQNSRAGLCATGLSTTGLLVKAYGRVMGSTPDGFVISDGSPGSGLKVLTKYAAVAIIPPGDGAIVSVTGAGASDGLFPAVVVRQAGDITVLAGQ